MYIKCILLLMVFIISKNCADIQYDGNLKYNIVKEHKYADPDGAEGFEFTSIMNAERVLHDFFIFTFYHQFVGVNQKDLFSEKNIPFDNIFDAGLRFTGLGTLQLNAINSVFFGAEPLSVPYYPAGTEIVPSMLSAGEGEWIGAFDWFHTDLKLSTLVYKFKLLPQDRYLPRDVIESQPYGEKRDVDIWTDLSAGVDLPVDIAIDGGVLLKNDLNGKDYYNIATFWAGLSGEHLLNRKKIILSWEATENLIQSKAMEENGYADGFTTDLKMRLLWRNGANFFIKGEACIDVASSLFKQYYGMQLRRTWKQGSSLDIVYFATNGVLFPRQNVMVNSILRLSDHFGINPSISFFMSQLPSESTFRYYRSDYKMELLFPVNQRFDFYTGYSFTHYDRHPLMSTRNSASAGFRTW